MNWKERKIFMIIGLIALFGPLICGPLFVGLSIGFSKIGLSYLSVITLKANNFFQWKLNYYFQIFFSILDIIIVCITIIVLMLTRNKLKQFAQLRFKFLLAMESAIALSLFIQLVSSCIYYNAGKSFNIFPLGYSEEQVERIEKEYGCCFPEKNYARKDCHCPIAKEYNTTERFGHANYDISSYMMRTNVLHEITMKARQKKLQLNQEIIPGTEECGECKEELWNI